MSPNFFKIQFVTFLALRNIANEYLLTKIGANTAEHEPNEYLILTCVNHFVPNFANVGNRHAQNRQCIEKAAGTEAGPAARTPSADRQAPPASPAAG